MTAIPGLQKCSSGSTQTEHPLAPADLLATEGTRRRQGIVSWPLEECTVGNVKLSLTGGL
ncbi:hypothetical protein ACRRTK_022186 [Alexandromys fortis]